MRPGIDLSIRQTQKLALTPQMEQSLSILQMGAEELNQYIEEEVLSNPMLDFQKDEGKREIRQSYGEGIRTHGQKRWDDDGDGQEYFNSIVDEKSYGTGLKEYLRIQLYAKQPGQERQRRAEYLIECLEESGYLKMEPDALASALQITEKAVEREVAFLQTFEPCGVFARNLKECLLLQLKGEDEETGKLRLLVENHLDEIAKNKIPQISKATGWGMEEVIEQICRLKERLEPIPGRGYGCATETFLYPDVTVKQEGDGYCIVYNRECVRPIGMNAEYLPLLGGGHTPEENRYFKEQYQKARFLLKNIGKREETLRLVAEAIVEYQLDFFDHGNSHLKPMNLMDIAQELGIHESTVSRAIKDKYLECRWGIFDMKYFFSNKTSEGNNCNVRSHIARMVQGEDKKKPLSDAKISKLLEAQGILVSRRTVAKYREQLSIPNTQQRREYR